MLLSLAVVVPIAIHLFNFHHFKVVFFTNVKVLKNLSMENKKQNKLFERLLLLLRCLLIVLLSLLFSQPYIKDENNQLANNTDNAVVVIVDNSFSMQNTSNKGSMLESAKKKAMDILNEYSNNDVFCLLTMDMEGKHKHFVSKQTFIDFLKDVDISSASYPYSQLLNTAHHLLSMRNEKNKRVFFVSDFQKVAFDGDKFKQEKNIKDVFLPLEVKNIDNVFIDSLILNKNIFQKGQKVDITVRISNYSNKEKEKLAVKLYIDNQQKSLVTIDNIKENSTIDVPMSFIVQKTGILQGKVHIIDNPITFDDDFFFTLNVNDKINVLCINGSGENKYLMKLFNNSDEVKIDNMSEKQIDFSKFSMYSTIIINSLTNLSSGLANEINRFRQSGGSIVVIPNENQNNTYSYNSSLSLMHLPSYSSIIEKQTKVGKIDTKNKLFKDVFSSITENMEMPTAKKYYKISGGNVSKQDIMSFVNNDAFLCESQSGNSIAYLLCVPLDEDFSNFTSQSVFVPTLWNMVLFSELLSRPFIFMNDNSFVDLSLMNKGTKDNRISDEVEKMKRETDENYVIPQMITLGNRQGFRLNNQIKKSGIYFIYDNEKTIGAIAINYPRNESKLVFMDQKQIKKQLKDIGYNNFSVFNDRKLISTYFNQSKKGFDFTYLLLILILSCLIGETYLLYKMKRQ